MITNELFIFPPKVFNLVELCEPVAIFRKCGRSFFDDVYLSVHRKLYHQICVNSSIKRSSRKYIEMSNFINFIYFDVRAFVCNQSTRDLRIYGIALHNTVGKNGKRVYEHSNIQVMRGYCFNYISYIPCLHVSKNTFSSTSTISMFWIGPLSDMPWKSHFLKTWTCIVVCYYITDLKA
jgi:hypothetical protein